MKKLFSLSVLFITAGLLFGQTVSAKNASRKTAERCLKLAENYLLSGDFSSAGSQAEMGLSYDDSISDLYYIKAVSEKNLGGTVRDVLELSLTAREKKLWIGYNEKGNRILLADLLSDTGRLDEALEELDRAPFVFSADAEAVRVKTYYRYNTEEYTKKARDKINSARRIYKGDVRFLNLFYSFETAGIIKNGLPIKPEAKVLSMADVLSQEMKNYKSIPADVECASVFFTTLLDSEKGLRAVKAFDAAGKQDILFSVPALISGYWSEDKAFEEFFRFADSSCTVGMLEFFASFIRSPEVLEKFYDHMNSYNGTLFLDDNNDLLWETKIAYERGRPVEITYDSDNDGVMDLVAKLDFGELLSVLISPLNTVLYYSDYPYLGSAGITVNKEDDFYTVFDFSKQAVAYSPVSFTKLFEEKFQGKENDFYLPVIMNGWNESSSLGFLESATFIRRPVPSESVGKENSSIIYSLLDGVVVNAVFVQDEVVYSSADFSEGIPTDRYVDSDGDGNFETHEIFASFTEDNSDAFTSEDKNYVKKLFPHFDFSNDIYLSSVQIDANNDNVPEYYEYFREKGGKICVWVKTGGNITYTRFPKNPEDPLVEENAFVVGLDQDTVSVMTIDGVPSSVKINETPFRIVKGEMKNLYWIGEEGNGAVEVDLFAKLSSDDIENGKVIVLEKEDKIYRAIKVSGIIYVREYNGSKVE